MASGRPALCLRPWNVEDAEAVVHAFASPGMDRQGGPITSVQDARKWLEAVLWGSTSDLYAFAVDAEGEAVGHVMLSAVDYTHATAWTSYWASSAVRGRGVTTRAVASLAQWGFDELGLFRLELGHRINNPASGAVARGAGFVQEGLERGKLQYDGERFDVAVYSRLATDPPPEVELLTVHGG